MTAPAPEDIARTRRVSWRGLLLIGIIALGLAQFTPWTTSIGREAKSRPDCTAWDRAASAGIAALVSDTSAAAEVRLDEAILQLRRARKNCRSGAIALAGHDYTSLHQAFPVSTGSIRATAQTPEQ